MRTGTTFSRVKSSASLSPSGYKIISKDRITFSKFLSPFSINSKEEKILTLMVKKLIGGIHASASRTKIHFTDLMIRYDVDIFQLCGLHVHTMPGIFRTESRSSALHLSRHS